jgi:hypothetical protein
MVMSQGQLGLHARLEALQAQLLPAFGRTQGYTSGRRDHTRQPDMSASALTSDGIGVAWIRSQPTPQWQQQAESVTPGTASGRDGWCRGYAGVHDRSVTPWQNHRISWSLRRRVI